MIYQLKRVGINHIDLVRIYISVIRPVVEYACPVWYTNLSGMVHELVRYGTRTCPVWHTNLSGMVHELVRYGTRTGPVCYTNLSGMVHELVRYGTRTCPVWYTHLPKYLSDNVEIIKKLCFKTIFCFTCEHILQMVNKPTPHDRHIAIYKVYFGRMRRRDHKLNKLLPDTRTVSYALRSFNELPAPIANTNRYKHSLIPSCLVHCQNTSMVYQVCFNIQF